MSTGSKPRPEVEFTPTPADITRLDQLVREYQAATSDHDRADIGAKIVGRLRVCGLGPKADQ